MILPRRIHLIGNSGVGKTTLAMRLSERLGIPHHNLDDIYWKRKYDIPRPKPARERLLDRLTQRRAWITESAGTSWTAHAVRRADLIIELDAPRPVLLFRVLRRSMRRRLSPTAPKESLLNLWRLCQYIWNYHNPARAKRQQYDRVLKRAKGRRVRVRSRRDLKGLLDTLPARNPRRNT